MDTSNPVVSNDRRTIAEVREQNYLKRRQNLQEIETLAATSPRTYLKTTLQPYSDYEVMKFVETLDKKIKSVDTPTKVGSVDAKNIEKILDFIPVSGLLRVDGSSVRDSRKNNSQGKVCVSRTFGCNKRLPYGVQPLLAMLGNVAEDVDVIYSYGTWEGFMKRIDLQMGRKTKSMIYAVQQSGIPAAAAENELSKMIDRLFPLNDDFLTEWPAWDENLTEHLNMIKITGTSSAGAPYWAPKANVIEDIVDEVMVEIVRAIKTGQLQKLFQEDRELFICELKNKLDRYDISKLKEKTRPYVCAPAHFTFLFSILSQRFQELLKIFTEEGVNAYGFSFVDGGLEKTLRKAYSLLELKQNKAIFKIHYGDDGSLYYKIGKELWRVDPDFKQMDGCIDYEDVSVVLDWVKRNLIKRKKEEESFVFWDQVFKIWRYFLTSPMFIIHGQAIYQKKRPNGLLSGVPGTTLVSTVKSAVLWELLFQDAFQNDWDPLDEQLVTSWMLKRGMIIKEGTYKPVLMPPVQEDGLPSLGLVTENLFLGVQMLIEEYKDKKVVVPTIPLHTAINMLLVQKDDPAQAAEKSRGSELGQARTLYDRLRGLYLTFGFAIPLITEAIHHAVNKLGATSILMTTNVEGGERPDMKCFENYSYPDSSGFPSKEFCYSLYSTEPTDHSLWVQIYPALVDYLNLKKLENRKTRVSLRDMEEQFGDLTFITTQPRAVLVPHLQPLREVAEVLDIPKNEIKTQTFDNSKTPNPRSNIRGSYETRKTLPKLSENIFLCVSACDIMPISDIVRKFRCSVEMVYEAVQEYSLFMTGRSLNDFVSVRPITTPVATPQKDVRSKIQQDKGKLTGIKARIAVSKNLMKPVIEHRIEHFTIEPGYIEDAKKFGRYVEPDPTIKNPIQRFSAWIQSVYHSAPVWLEADDESDPEQKIVSIAMKQQGVVYPLASVKGSLISGGKRELALCYLRELGEKFEVDEFSYFEESKPSTSKEGMDWLDAKPPPLHPIIVHETEALTLPPQVQVKQIFRPDREYTENPDNPQGSLIRVLDSQVRSKNSLLTPERRARKNRRNLERRKEKLRSLRGDQ